MTDRNRQPKGIPTGGEFAKNEHGDAPGGLAHSEVTVDVREGTNQLGSSYVKKVDARTNGSTVTFENEDGEEVEVYLDLDADEFIDPSVHLCEDGNYHVVYANLDDSGDDYNFTEGDSVTEFRSASDRDEFIESKIASGVDARKIFVLDKFSHGNVKYTVQPEGWDRDRPMDQWDSAPSTVLIVDEDGAGGVPEDQYRAAAEAIADDYTKWANGETYGIVQVTVDSDGEIVDGSEQESVWGYVGSEYTEKSIASGEF